MGQIVCMQIFLEQGVFLQFCVCMVNVRIVVEIGVFIGYFLLVILLVMQELYGDVVWFYVCDINVDYFCQFKCFWDQVGVMDLIEMCQGDVVEMVYVLVEDIFGEVDMMFIDVDKVNYDIYYEVGFQFFCLGGLMLLDNVLWFGDVMDVCKCEGDCDICVFYEIVEKIWDDSCVDMVFMVIGDGIFMVIKC